MNWPGSTNRGTALLRLLHQYEKDVLVKDDYVRWFVDDTAIQSADATRKSLEDDSRPESQFQRIAYRYGILREKFFDDLIEAAVHDGCRQLLLLGSGFDTRFLRLSPLREGHIQTFEVDMPATVREKRAVLERRMGAIPTDLHLVPMDFRTESLDVMFGADLRNDLKTACVWQGVTYYLPERTVSSVLDFVRSALPSGTLLGFDCCSPLMLKENEFVPDIEFNIRRLNEIGEPYLFGRYMDDMRGWLDDKCYQNITILDQRMLESRYLGTATLPQYMWCVVSAKTSGSFAQ